MSNFFLTTHSWKSLRVPRCMKQNQFPCRSRPLSLCFQGPIVTRGGWRRRKALEVCPAPSTSKGKTKKSIPYRNSQPLQHLVHSLPTQPFSPKAKKRPLHYPRRLASLRAFRSVSKHLSSCQADRRVLSLSRHLTHLYSSINANRLFAVLQEPQIPQVFPIAKVAPIVPILRLRHRLK